MSRLTTYVSTIHKSSTDLTSTLAVTRLVFFSKFSYEKEPKYLETFNQKFGKLSQNREQQLIKRQQQNISQGSNELRSEMLCQKLFAKFSEVKLIT